MADNFEDEAAREVAAMQFAGGMTVTEVAAHWERDTGWVEAAVRRALLDMIPRRDGGLKPPRMEERTASSREMEAWRASQGTLKW